MMTKLLQKEMVKLKCPHCTQEIIEAWIFEMDSIIGMRYAYLCSKCQELLGISSIKDLSSVKFEKNENLTLNSGF